MRISDQVLTGTPPPVCRMAWCWRRREYRATRHSAMWILWWHRSSWSVLKPRHRPSGEQSSAGLSGDCVLTGRTPRHDMVTRLSGY